MPEQNNVFCHVCRWCWCVMPTRCHQPRSCVIYWRRSWQIFRSAANRKQRKCSVQPSSRHYCRTSGARWMDPWPARPHTHPSYSHNVGDTIFLSSQQVTLALLPASDLPLRYDEMRLWSSNVSLAWPLTRDPQGEGVLRTHHSTLTSLLRTTLSFNSFSSSFQWHQRGNNEPLANTRCKNIQLTYGILSQSCKNPIIL